MIGVFGVVGTGRKVELGDKGKMIEQGDGRSRTDTDIREGVAASSVAVV